MSSYWLLAECKNGGGGPGPFYHVDDVSVYLGRQMGGWEVPIETMHILNPAVPDLTVLREKEEQIRKSDQCNFDQHHQARELEPLYPGQKVWVTDRGEEAEVVQEAGTCLYQVQTPDGKFRRNRRALIDLPNTNTTDLIDSNETSDIVTNETNMAEASVQEQSLKQQEETSSQ